MSQDDWDSPEHQALYLIPIETLGLSEKAIKAVKRTGIEYVGDCVDFFARGNDALIQVPFGFLDAMYDEVKPKLQAHGFWSPDTSDTA